MALIGLDHLAHPGGRLGPLHREPPSDVGADLAAEAQDEPALRQQLDVVGAVGQRHRVAGEAHHDAGAELHRGSRVSDEREHGERVVAGLWHPQPVVAQCFLFSARLHDAVESAVDPEAAVYLHGGDDSGPRVRCLLRRPRPASGAAAQSDRFRGPPAPTRPARPATRCSAGTGGPRGESRGSRRPRSAHARLRECRPGASSRRRSAIRCC